ncbi:MAG: RDD family protein [Nanoarchaeota archaeon]|nr:RDD family protein [Nanoarchaeota archaeon]
MKKILPNVALWKRIIAYLIDLLVISFLIMTPLMRFTERPATFSEIFTSITSTQTITVSILVSLLSLFYWAYLEYKFGQSVGKIIMKLSVKSTLRKKLSFTQTVIRSITKLSTILIILDTLYMLYKKGNQRYFEIISKTKVIEVKK